MLPGRFHITYPQFRKIKSQQSKIYGGMFDLYVKKVKEGGAKVSIFVPGYLDKRSVRRNKTRRKLEAMINNLPYLKDCRKTAVLVKAKKIFLKKDEPLWFEEVKKSFGSLL